MTPADQLYLYGRIRPLPGRAKRDMILMNEPLAPPPQQVRCCACHRLLFCADAEAIAAAIRIKCPRCKALNILRPDRAPTIERPARQAERRDACPPRPPSIR